jgi:GT2 family glycosyltransferase
VRELEREGPVRLIRQENRGLSTARNVALEQARGRYAAMLDSDDLWLPTYLETMGRALDEHPEAGLAYTDAWVLDDRTRRIQRFSAMSFQDPPEPPPADSQAFLRLLLQRNFVFTAATVPLRVLEEVGLYDPRLGAAEDYELWLRIAAAGYPAVRPPGRHAVYRKRPGSLSTDGERIYVGMRDTYRLVAEEYDVSPEVQAIARRRLAAAEAQLAGLAGRGGLRGLLVRGQARLTGLKRAVLEPFVWYRRPPAEVARAFPDLQAR